MPPSQSPERLNVVIAGHVDHGKSSVVGRLLADSGSLPDGKLDQIRALCQRTGRPFEYAFLLDALKDERAQGITIDTARVFFRTPLREYLVFDAPGHVEFVRNLVTGASRADAALLVVDAAEGIQENSRRHGYLLGLLGIGQLVVVVNKMDLVGFDEAAFGKVADEFRAFLAGIGLDPMHIIPVSAGTGAGIVTRDAALAWFAGPTVLQALEGFTLPPPPDDAPFRMPVQDVYKFTGRGDHRRIVAGTIESGSLRVGDEVVFYPSGKRGTVKSLEAFARNAESTASAGQAAGFTLTEQLYVTRGEVACRADQSRPEVTTRVRAGLFWLGRRPLTTDREYLLKVGSARVPLWVEKIHRVLDAASLEVRAPAESVDRHQVAECTLRLGRPIAADIADSGLLTARFVIVDGYEIAGGGLLREALTDAATPLRNKVFLRNAKWETSFVSPDARSARYRQRPTLLLITGPKEVDRKSLAKALEAHLFEAGQVVYYIGMANVLYGLDADLGRAALDRTEHLRRLAEMAHLLLDAGVLLIVTAAELTGGDLELISAAVSPDRLVSVWLGPRRPGDPLPDLDLDSAAPIEQGVEALGDLLRRKGAFQAAAAEPARLEPMVVWLTGLPASGKSSIADLVADLLRKRGLPVERLDGDAMRDCFPSTGFSRAERDEHIRRVGFLAGRLRANGIFVVASFVSPYADARAFVRRQSRSFLEVHVSTPLEECQRRDPKGLYARARRGEVTNLTGVNDPYEVPDAPDVRVDTSAMSNEEAAQRVVAALDRKGRAP